ncbi:hypothetical protein BDN67DRAFT_649019 [Paxillus ammoniavirescens]|nr:hypothetical protein BDN67DRAFT_649019 [Paxillus ammoniavirescens]
MVHGGSVYAIVVFKDGKIMASGGYDGRIVILSRTGFDRWFGCRMADSLQHPMTRPSNIGISDSEVLPKPRYSIATSHGHKTSVFVLAISPDHDGKLLASV